MIEIFITRPNYHQLIHGHTCCRWDVYHDRPIQYQDAIIQKFNPNLCDYFDEIDLNNSHCLTFANDATAHDLLKRKSLFPESFDSILSKTTSNKRRCYTS
ncbi:unnamed protein product [Mucor hiemalis]